MHDAASRGTLAAFLVAGLVGCSGGGATTATSDAPDDAARTMQAAQLADPADPSTLADDGTGAEVATPPAVDGAKVPLYWDKEIPAAALEGRSLRELSLMRNTIYARTGHTFHTPWLAGYFASQPWYEARETPDTSLLTDVDVANAEAIGRYEASLTRDQLQARARTLRQAEMDGKATPHAQVEVRLLSRALGDWVGGKEQRRSPLEDPSRLDAILVLGELEGMSRRDLRLLRNTIYARRGREFRSDLLTMHFHHTEWYEPDPEYSDARLTPIDHKNIRLVLSVEQQHGGPLSDWEHMQQVDFFFGA